MTNDTNPSPAMNTASPTEIPAGIYYSKLLDNFYDMETECGKGADFHGKWYERRSEFPDESSGSGAAPVGQGSAKSEAEKMLAMRADYDRQSAAKRGTLAGQGSATSGEALARQFHDTYERLAPSFGYETRSDTRKFDPASSNGQLMIAVCGELRAALAASAEQSNTPVSDEAADAHKRLDDAAIERDEDGKALSLWGRIMCLALRHERLAAPVTECTAAPASVPEGWKLVPLKLTPEMADVLEFGRKQPSQNTYLNLLAAAPEVAQPAAQGESIEVDPEFRKLAWRYREANDQNANAMLAVLIDCINAWGKSLATPAPTAGEASARTDEPAPAFDFHAHLARQAAWSRNTFGPGMRTAGVCDHIRKELLEIEADPSDLREWIDVVILALDGAWRCGGSPDQIIGGIAAKQAKNEGRSWPDWRTADPNKTIEHDRSGEVEHIKVTQGGKEGEA